MPDSPRLPGNTTDTNFSAEQMQNLLKWVEEDSRKLKVRQEEQLEESRRLKNLQEEQLKELESLRQLRFSFKLMLIMFVVLGVAIAYMGLSFGEQQAEINALQAQLSSIDNLPVGTQAPILQPPVTETLPVPTSQPRPGCTARVSTGRPNVPATLREAPDPAAVIAQRLTLGDELRVIATQADSSWVRVEFVLTGKLGWLLRQQIILDDPNCLETLGTADDN
jgi:hypothetical protein